jgi:hypothetical protein
MSDHEPEPDEEEEEEDYEEEVDGRCINDYVVQVICLSFIH